MNNNAQALMQQRNFYRRNCNAYAVSMSIDFKSLNKHPATFNATMHNAQYNLTKLIATMQTLMKIS